MQPTPSGGALLHQEVAAAQLAWNAVVVEIRRDDLVAPRSEHVDDRPATGSRLPDGARGQRMDAQQRLYGDGRSLIEIRTALGERLPLNLAGMI
jgi:hypothetical protein